MDKKTQGSQSSVTLKRSVTMKAVVTEDFRKYLVFEVQQAIGKSKERFAQIERDAAQMIESAKSQPDAQQRIAQINGQVQNEHNAFQQALKQLDDRMKAVAELKDGALFSQGTVDGWVSVKVGDNLYKKLGGMEIIVKDGVVQEILPGGMQAK